MFKKNHKLTRTWGFRFSLTDVLVLCAFAGFASGLFYLANPLWWLLLVVVAHFFLFCNVFRVARHHELIWAILFVANVLLLAHWQELDWPAVLVTQVPITTAIIFVELRSATYHGIFARQLNPQLANYLEGRIL
jgi:hypothetical protein